MGGTPRHGSLFMVEENDGSVFVIEINGDSGVGKSEMIAAFVLKWLRNNLEGIRSVKMVAGDMFHEFQDADGNLYGIGTEVGDFSRTTDFDPDYIKYYKYLFESSADSNVDDRNARSTVSGMCDITMPYKVDIMLSASNYSKNEGGITRIDNPENFLLYIDAHGERKEKATSGDGPNFQCTLKRYTADKNIVEVISRHGNYLDDILDWDFSPADQQYYLASSFKLLDKIDITEVVKMIFAGRSFTRDGVAYTIENVAFDMIQNRFIATVSYRFGDDRLTDEKQIDRKMFSAIFDALASTPGGQPFISEEGQVECIHNLITCLRGGKDGKGGARHIQCGVLSTEIGKKGREITGPQKAAAALKQLIQEVRVNKPEINEGKIKVKRLLNEKYRHLFHGEMNSSELWRYNFYLYQLDNMRKADLRRMDNKSKKGGHHQPCQFPSVRPESRIQSAVGKSQPEHRTDELRGNIRGIDEFSELSRFRRGVCGQSTDTLHHRRLQRRDEHQQYDRTVIDARRLHQQRRPGPGERNREGKPGNDRSCQICSSAVPEFAQKTGKRTGGSQTGER